MASEATHIQVVKVGSKYVYEARDGSGKAVETSKQYATEAAAAQAGADAYGHQYGDGETADRNPATGEVEVGPEVVQLGLPVRHAVVNDGKPEYGEDDGPGPGTVQ